MSAINSLLTKAHTYIFLRRIGRDQALQIYKTMQLARTLDNALEDLRLRGKIVKILFSGRGEEAGPAVISQLLRDDDPLLPNYRGYAHVLARGIPPTKIIAELIGSKSGIAGGKGSLGNYADPHYHVYLNPITLGAGFGVALGMALACKFAVDRRIVTIFFGDGMATRSTFFPALNFATTHNLAILFVCINNQYSITQKTSTVSKITAYETARAFKMKSATVNGNQIRDVYQSAVGLIQEVRTKSRPALLELQTFRMGGHNAEDPGTYQSQEDIAKWAHRDPIHQYRNALILSGGIGRGELEEIDQDITSQIMHAVHEALRSNTPSG